MYTDIYTYTYICVYIWIYIYKFKWIYTYTHYQLGGPYVYIHIYIHIWIDIHIYILPTRGAVPSDVRRHESLIGNSQCKRRFEKMRTKLCIFHSFRTSRLEYAVQVHVRNLWDIWKFIVRGSHWKTCHTISLQHTAMRHTATYCNATHCNILQCDTLQHTATRHTATYCNATHCNMLQQHKTCHIERLVPQSRRTLVLQCTVVCCSMLQHAAVSCSA